MRRACILGAGNSAHVVAGLVSSLDDWECHVYAPRKDLPETFAPQRFGFKAPEDIPELPSMKGQGAT